MYNVITNQDDEIYVTDTNEILALDALTKKDLDLALENYLPLSAGIDKKLTGDLYFDNNKFIKGYTTASTLRNLIGVNTASAIELGDTNANINVKASSAFRPATNSAITLGTDTLQWKEIYGTTIYQDGKQVANKEDLTNLENNKVNITNSDTTQSIYNHIYNDINNQMIISSAGADFDPSSEEDLPNSSNSSYFFNNPALQVIQNIYKDNEGNQTLSSISQYSGIIMLQTQSQNGSSMINVGDGVTQIGDGNDFYNFENTSLNNTNNADLGTSTNKFKDLYLSGKLSNGTNEVTIDDIINKVDKIEGKGLSTEDFTTELKEKLASIDTTIVEISSSGDVAQEIAPNTYYKFTSSDISTLSITLGLETTGIVNEYMFEFIASDSTTLNLPDSIKWIGGVSPSIVSGKTYQVSIVNNLAVYGEF